MKHYKDAKGNLFAYEEDGSQDHLIGDKEFIPKDQVAQVVEAKQQAAFDAQDWYRKRINSYPELGEFVDAYVKGDAQAMEEYKRKCLEVKAKYPKPPGF